MATRKRRTIEERIAEAQAKIKALEAKKLARESKLAKPSKTTVKLTKDTEGMSDLLGWIDHIVTQNKVKAADVIKAAAKLKRTGLVFTRRAVKTEE